MSKAMSPQNPNHVLTRLDTNLPHLASTRSPDQTASPSSTRSGTFARLRMGAEGIRRSKSLRSLGRTRSEGTMSIYSDAATVAEPVPPLPTSASELTLAHSYASSARSIKDESPTSMAKSFMRRSSRLLLKKTSKSSLHSRTLDWIDETQVTNSEASSPRRAVRERISQPFNFQHITHTAADLSDANKIGSHCIRPSRELKGIKAHDLPAPSSAMESTFASAHATESELRTSRSMDSFKRVKRASFSTPYPPTIPPPRKSSRRPPPLVMPMNRQFGQESPTIPDFMLSGRRGSSTSKGPTPKSPLSISYGADDSPLSMMGIAQAVTTPDESACMAKSELMSPLEDVPEEGVASPQLRSPASPSSRSIRNSTQRMVRSGSDPVLPEGAEQLEEIPVRASRRISGRVVNGVYLDLDWDEDIDYCYDQLEADGVELKEDNTDSPASDADILYMKARRRSNRLSRQGVPLHLRRISTQQKEHGLGLLLPSEQPAIGPEVDVAHLAASEDYAPSEKSPSQLPLFTPDMAGGLPSTYSPRSSVSQMSKYPSGSSSHAVSAMSSKRTSAALVANENVSTISVPDLIPSSKRKSSSTRPSSVRSHGSTHNVEAGSSTSTLIIPVPSPKKESAKQGALLEPSRIPLRKRSFSESATKTLAIPVAKSTATHTRAISHAPGSSRPTRPYTLFPPLDRIGATSTKA